jgi:hypothetical protein
MAPSRILTRRSSPPKLPPSSPSYIAHSIKLARSCSRDGRLDNKNSTAACYQTFCQKQSTSEIQTAGKEHLQLLD